MERLWSIGESDTEWHNDIHVTTMCSVSLNDECKDTKIITVLTVTSKLCLGIRKCRKDCTMKTEFTLSKCYQKS